MGKGLDSGRNLGHTYGMKTAISLPDHLFDEVSRLAKKIGTSRSQIFREAVEAYLERLRSERMLEALDAVYSEKETRSERLLRKRSREHYAGKILRKDSDDDQAG